VDLDLRLVRYFIVVAEHGNFRRAADALHLAQPSLSRQIQRLEERLGARLLDRSRQGSQLTLAGRAFLPQTRALLSLAQQASASTRAAAQPDGLAVGYAGDLSVTTVVRELRLRHPRAEIAALYVSITDARSALLGHRVDVVLARGPIPAAQLSLTVLYEEPRVLVMPTTHRLADRPVVTLADFADEPLVRHPDPAYDAFWRIIPRPGGAPAPDGPLAATARDKLELVAMGEALAVAPDSDTLRVMHPGLATVPIAGIEPARVLLAARADDRARLTQEFRAIAVERLGRPSPLLGRTPTLTG
jgi:DNA-binding transcriptional LysR family regulator